MHPGVLLDDAPSSRIPQHDPAPGRPRNRRLGSALTRRSTASATAGFWQLHRRRGGLEAMLEVARDALQHARGDDTIAFADLCKRRGDSRLHRSRTYPVRSHAQFCEAQDDTAPVVRMLDALQKPLRFEPLQHASQRARVHVQNARKVAGREPWKEADNAQHQPLRTSHAQSAGHPLRGPLQAVHNRPQQLQEAEYIRQWRAGSAACGRLDQA